MPTICLVADARVVVVVDSVVVVLADLLECRFPKGVAALFPVPVLLHLRVVLDFLVCLKVCLKALDQKVVLYHSCLLEWSLVIEKQKVKLIYRQV